MDEDDDFELTLKEDVLKYLDKTEQVSRILQKCKQIFSQTEEKGQVLSFEVNIDVGDLTDVSSSLTSVILHDPDKAQRLFQEVIYTTLRCLQHLPDRCSLSQIQVSLRVSNLPSLSCYKIFFKQLHECNFESRYYTFHGFVCSKSPPQEYSKSTRYCCQDKDCKGSQGNDFIRLYNRGSPESQVIRRDFPCAYCGRVLQEDVHARVLGEKVVIQMVNICVASEGLKLRQSFNIILRDELISDIKIGSQYSVVGIPEAAFYKENQVRVTFEASSVTPFTEVPTQLTQGCIPESISRYHIEISSSPWRLSSRLAFIFASEITPKGTFHLLKMCIMLSLVQTGVSNKVNSRLDILAVGREDRLIDRLFQYGAKFLSSCFHGNVHPLFPSVRESQFGSIIDGGAVLLAGDGVCLLGDISFKGKNMQERISKVLQEKCLQVEVSKKGNESNKNFEQFVVGSTLWAHQNKKDSTSDHILGSFGLVVNCDSHCSSVEDVVQVKLCQDLLVKAINPYSHLTESVTFEDLQQFLLTVARRKVSFSSEAETLLKGYFVTSRKIYEGSLKRRQFPLTTLQTLSSLAVAHAKLSLHEEVVEEDAVMAVHIFEECLSARFGPSFLNVHHQPHLKDDKLSAHCGPEHDLYMRQFQRQLKLFCNPTDDTPAGGMLSPFISED
ncbi:minichromosome maintenance domain-containing protein 2-like [Apostichopus japonicus]|uniref:minichromosome maintenance domain-containing protein 2-like n=1 Tax=Stichopus japonicus TaxID=307972 RepID=UPI003AB10E45